MPSFPVLLDPSGKPDHQAIHCPTANFGALSRGRVTNSILITVFHTYFSQRSSGPWTLTHDPFNSECRTLTHFSISLAQTNVNLKEPYNQDIKE